MDSGTTDTSTTDSPDGVSSSLPDDSPAPELTSRGVGYQWKKFSSVLPVKLKTSTSAKDDPSQHQQGYDSGHAEGLADGLRQGQVQAENQTKAVLAELKHMLQEVKQVRDRTVVDGLQDIAVAFHSLFQQVFLHELKTSPTLIESLANELKQTLLEESVPTIHVSQGTYNALQLVDVSEHLGNLVMDEGLPDGVIRASAGKAMAELDVMANLEQVLASACAVEASNEVSGAELEC